MAARILADLGATAGRFARRDDGLGRRRPTGRRGRPTRRGVWVHGHPVRADRAAVDVAGVATSGSWPPRGTCTARATLIGRRCAARATPRYAHAAPEIAFAALTALGVGAPAGGRRPVDARGRAGRQHGRRRAVPPQRRCGDAGSAPTSAAPGRSGPAPTAGSPSASEAAKPASRRLETTARLARPALTGGTGRSGTSPPPPTTSSPKSRRSSAPGSSNTRRASSTKSRAQTNLMLAPVNSPNELLRVSPTRSPRVLRARRHPP